MRLSRLKPRESCLRRKGPSLKLRAIREEIFLRGQTSGNDYPTLLALEERPLARYEIPGQSGVAVSRGRV